ncbi:hypothetical protein BOTBODRAFT_26119 [Botryobasidium botryosum FD-172 SS1]|uniref:RING-type domain-containing protein n=1 Tax=Botryobasidium botryosum (strain FD-172 SS1) TaxID=930990 RepID=A0A067N1F2_BOTB1|nr:hypothetical protein BOTBODRAFT_26119 [Botryobasidium botryosum FD-172 SS1]
MEYDIFTLARDRGAIASVRPRFLAHPLTSPSNPVFFSPQLLYSTTSVACLINPEYTNMTAFDRVMDIFATNSSSSAKLILSQLSNINQSYYWYDPAKLNASSNAVTNFIATGMTSNKYDAGFLIAMLKAANVTDNSPMGPTPGTTAGGNGGGGGGSSSPSTGLAMIILYAITGCVSALFCIVILSGAIRAIRHPERYGPRAGVAGLDGTAVEAQTRTAGLTRAILDTFPVIKFGSAAPPTNLTPTPTIPPKDSVDKGWDLERGPRGEGGDVLEMKVMSSEDGMSDPDHHGDDEEKDRGHRRASSSGTAGMHGKTDSAEMPMPPLPFANKPANESTESFSVSRARGPDIPPSASDHPHTREGEASGSGEGGAAGDDSLDADAIGVETCPICIVDFEVDDEIRVLPCDGHHRFHKDCVDPWLLELSASCPICRKDFHALETMASRHPGDENESNPDLRATMSEPPRASFYRISRYLRFAERRRQRRDRREQQRHQAYTNEEDDEPDSPVPRAESLHSVPRVPLSTTSLAEPSEPVPPLPRAR